MVIDNDNNLQSILPDTLRRTVFYFTFIYRGLLNLVRHFFFFFARITDDNGSQLGSDGMYLVPYKNVNQSPPHNCRIFEENTYLMVIFTVNDFLIPE